MYLTATKLGAGARGYLVLLFLLLVKSYLILKYCLSIDYELTGIFIITFILLF